MGCPKHLQWSPVKGELGLSLLAGFKRKEIEKMLAADHLKKHPLKMMSTLTIVLNHSKEEEEE